MSTVRRSVAYVRATVVLLIAGGAMPACGTDASSTTPGTDVDAGATERADPLTDAGVDSHATDSGVAAGQPTYTIGGTVSGFNNSGIRLKDRSVDLAWINGNGAYTFPKKRTSGEKYVVTLDSLPIAHHQKCVVANGEGTITDHDVTDILVTCKTVSYVNAATGKDEDNTGGPLDPWQTLTRAIANAPPFQPVDIYVAPGTYAVPPETRPLKPKSGQNFIGDIATRGMGAGGPATIISGVGAATYTGGDLAGGAARSHTILFESGVTGAAFRGFVIEGSVGFDAATATLEAVTISGDANTGIVVANASNASVVGAHVTGGESGLWVVDSGTKVHVRGTTFIGGTGAGVELGFSTPFTGSNIDLGTAASPGNNSLQLGFVSLRFRNTANGSVVKAAGNTWRPDVQGANATGIYGAMLIDGNAVVPASSGNNYAIPAGTTGAGSGIQL